MSPARNFDPKATNSTLLIWHATHFAYPAFNVGCAVQEAACNFSCQNRERPAAAESQEAGVKERDTLH